jgi:outer membrane biosynthesis protein TonB
MSQRNQPEPRDEEETQPDHSNLPIWKTTIIQILRGTIGLLETAVVKLEAQPLADATPTPNFWQRIQISWERFLRQLRLFIPSSVSNNLSDPALTGILAGLVIVLVWTGSSLFTGKQTEIATVPPVEEVPAPTTTVTSSPAADIPKAEPSAEITPVPEPTPTEEPEIEPEIEPTPIEEPQAVEPEIEPTPIEEPQPAPTPEPTAPVELTPEQALIAAIENQVAEISQKTLGDRFPVGLIKSIQANFRTSDLTVKISDDWYALEAKQQNQLAADIFRRSQELDFSYLEIVDAADKLIARSPVVGTEMIIFNRKL